ncbi:sugar kinase [soil metagenome]
MSNIVTFGEIMLRLSPPGKLRFAQAENFDATYGGAEANVAVSLAELGMNSYYVSSVPNNDIGLKALQTLRKYGVYTDFIIKDGDRLGIYFLENGASLRSSNVIYDRAGSSICQMAPDAINWSELFKQQDWFHWSGITPALGKLPAEAVKQACKAAKESGLTVSCDLNFRSKLWTAKEARQVMVPLMDYVDVCIANKEHAEKCLGFDTESIGNSDNRVEHARSVSRALKKEFNFQSVVMTLRETFSASRCGWSAVLHDDKDCKKPVRSTRYEFDIVDRVGAGDAFAAGLIYGLLNIENSKDALEFATAACCIKHSIHEEFNIVSVDEVQDLAKSGGGIDMKR